MNAYQISKSLSLLEALSPVDAVEFVRNLVRYQIRVAPCCGGKWSATAVYEGKYLGLRRFNTPTDAADAVVAEIDDFIRRQQQRASAH